MANKIGEAGKSTYAMAKKRHNRALLYAVTGLIAVIVIAAIIMNSQALGLGGGLVLLLFILVNFIPNLVDKKVTQKKREEKRAIRGAIAEEKVDSLLSELGEGYVILNDIESPYGNIDHLVISQSGGIFLLETKSHHGRVELAPDNSLLLSGRAPEKNFIAQALNNAYWVRDQVAAIVGQNPWINPLLVFTNAIVPGNLKIKGVTVLNKKYLLSQIQSRQARNAVTAKVWENRAEICARLAKSYDAGGGG